VATVHAALDAGVMLIDTALAYTRPGPTALACAERNVAYLAYTPFGGPAGSLPPAALAVAPFGLTGADLEDLRG
jgi:hypothetical protein